MMEKNDIRAAIVIFLVILGMFAYTMYDLSLKPYIQNQCSEESHNLSMSTGFENGYNIGFNDGGVYAEAQFVCTLEVAKQFDMGNGQFMMPNGYNLSTTLSYCSSCVFDTKNLSYCVREAFEYNPVVWN